MQIHLLFNRFNMAIRYVSFANNFEYDELVNVFDDDLLQSHDDAVNIHEVVAEIRHQCNLSASAHNNLAFPLETNAEHDAFSALENAIDQLYVHERCNTKSCANCSKPRRVTNVSSLKRGQHISMPGQYSTKYVRLERKLRRLYDHHAIVKDIQSAEGTLITMVLIHFTKIDGKLGVFEETKEFDLREKEIYIVDYVFPRYDPDKVVARAESILSQRDKFKTYNVITGNCEHFATWCVVGEGESFQVQSLRQSIADGLSRLLGAGSKIAKGIFRLLFVSADEIAGGFNLFVPELVLIGSAALYLLYCIVMTALHKRDYNQGKMCWSCLKGKILDLWLTLLAFVITSIFTFAVFHFALPLMTPGAGIPLIISLVLLSLAAQINVPRLRKALSTPFSVDRMKVTSLCHISIGDVILQRYCGVKHTSIVTNVKTEHDKLTKGRIRLIHYGCSGLFKTRKIIEEWVEVDIDKSTIYLLVCESLCTFPADVVVKRARCRIGETKWDIFSNRSDHFSYWAKVDLNNDDIFDEISYEEIRRPLSRTKASFFIEKREIHQIKDLKTGDVVKSVVLGIIDNTGILSSIKYLDCPTGRKFEIEVYTYTFLWTVTRQKYTIDLNKDRLFVKVYTPTQCQTMEQRVKNAKDIEGMTGSWWTTEGFIEHCIERKSQ